MSSPANNNLLSVTKASSLLGVHPDTLRRIEEKGQVVPHLKVLESASGGQSGRL